MSITEQQDTHIPTGTFGADRVHSSVAFEVGYMGIGAFSGTVTDFDASLADGRLSGSARIESLETKDENLHAHLMAPDFFDAERHPESSRSRPTSPRSRATRSASRASSRSRAITRPGDAQRARSPARSPIPTATSATA